MKITFNGTNAKCAFRKGTVAALIEKMKLRREEVLVKVNGSLAPDDAELSGSDKVDVFKVVFGG